MIFAARQGIAIQHISIRLCNIRYSAEPVIASRSADANGMPVAGSGAVPGGYSGGQVAKYFLGEGNCRSSASRCRSVPAVLGTSASKLMEAAGLDRSGLNRSGILRSGF